MKRPPAATIAVFALAGLLALLYVRPVLGDVLRTGLGWPIWVDHPEGLIHTNAGKWWVLPPHHYLVDGSSGEFPIYYANLSDTLLNVVAEATGWPVMTVQAVLYGPALAFGFLLLNYVSLAAVLRDRRAALAASVLLSLGGNATFASWREPVSGLPLNAVLHVPFSVLTLGTAQSLGWLLFLPCLALTHVAYRRRSAPLAAATGLSLGLLFHAHTLTFVNAATAQLAYLVLANALDRPRGGRFRSWLAALAATAAAFALLVATRPAISFPAAVAVGALALGATFLIDPAKRFYVFAYGTAGLVALPYLLLLARQAPQVAAVQAAWAEVQKLSVGLPGFVAFFAAYLLGAAAAYAYSRDRESLVWASALLGATAFLALNQYWHWYNHPYRFTIHLLFPARHPLGAGAARRSALAGGGDSGCGSRLSCCTTGPASRSAGAARWRPCTVSPRPSARRSSAPFSEITRAQALTGARILAPAEFAYARGLVQADDAHGLLARARLRSGLPLRAVAAALPQPHGPLLLPLPRLPEPRLPVRRSGLRREARPAVRARRAARRAPAHGHPAGLLDQLRRRPRQAVLRAAEAGERAVRLADAAADGQQRLRTAPTPRRCPALPASAGPRRERVGSRSRSSPTGRGRTS